MGYRSARRRVLIVDDVPEVRESLRWLIENEPDLEVVGDAADGDGLLLLVAETSPDLVLLDVRLPGVDGFTLARRIGALPTPPNVILLTARGMSQSPEGLVVVDKSDGWPALISRIHQVLAGRTG